MLKAPDNYFQRKAQKYGYVSLNKNVSHGFNMLVTIIWGDDCLVTARVRWIMVTGRAKPDSRITSTAIGLVVTNDANPCFCVALTVANYIEPFLSTA